MQPLWNEGAYQGQLLEEKSFANAWEIQRQENRKGWSDGGRRISTVMCWHWHIPDLEAPTECEDKERVSELKTSCASEARMSNERHEDHDNDVEPSMSVNDVEGDYVFHNDTAFVQVELGLKDNDVEETEGLSQIRPTLQAFIRNPRMDCINPNCYYLHILGLSCSQIV